jgi:hypothetical protein
MQRSCSGLPASRLFTPFTAFPGNKKGGPAILKITRHLLAIRSHPAANTPGAPVNLLNS